MVCAVHGVAVYADTQISAGQIELALTGGHTSKTAIAAKDAEACNSFWTRPLPSTGAC